MNYLDQIRIAYDASGPKGACGMILVVASEIARSQGRYDHRLIFKTLLDAGFKEFIPSFTLTHTLMSNCGFYEMRERRDTPLKQLKEINQILTKHTGFNTKIPDELAFMHDVIMYALEINLQSFMGEQLRHEEKQESTGVRTIQYMYTTSKWIDEHGLDSPVIRAFKNHAIVAKLRK